MGGDLERSSLQPVPYPIDVGHRIDATLSTTPGATPSTITWTVDASAHVGNHERRTVSFATRAGWNRVELTVTTDEGATAIAVVERP